MFRLFKKKVMPSFPLLQESAYRDMYFVRMAEWDWIDGSRQHIVVYDPHQPRLLTFDPWPELVFIAANGQLTVSEYIHYMARQYSGDVPALLDQTVLDELKTLLEYRIIEMRTEQCRPNHLFELPRSERSH